MGLFQRFRMSKGQQYYKTMGFDQYELSAEEEAAFCDYYEFHMKSRLCEIAPITKEALEATSLYAKMLPDVCLLFCDDMGNYAGVYHRGVLRGKVLFLCPSQPFYAPLFKDIFSFIDHIKRGRIKNLALPETGICDYPNRSAEPEETGLHLQLANELLGRLSIADDGELYFRTALGAMYLMPPNHLHLLFPLVWDENPHVREEVSNIFAFHKYRWAIPILASAAESFDEGMRECYERAIATLVPEVNVVSLKEGEHYESSDVMRSNVANSSPLVVVDRIYRIDQSRFTPADSEKLNRINQLLPAFIGYYEDPYWYGSVNDEFFLYAEHSSGGVHVTGRLTLEQFQCWEKMLHDLLSIAGLPYHHG